MIMCTVFAYLKKRNMSYIIFKYSPKYLCEHLPPNHSIIALLLYYIMPLNKYIYA